MSDVRMFEGRELVAEVRAATALHQASWEDLVPNLLEVRFDAEEAEEAAYYDMQRAKAALLDHICRTYGISAGELYSLARP